MSKKMKEVDNKIKRSGIIEFIFLSASILFQKVFSLLSIFIFNARGYNIERSVILGRHVSIFQSKKNSIKIGAGTLIEDGVRIRAGFDGKIILGKNVKVHDYSFIYAHESLTIGDNTLISPNVFITDFNHKFPHSLYKDKLLFESSYSSKQVKIGKNVWIGTKAIILPGVTLGDDCVIGAGSIVTKSVPSRSVAVGNPAKVVRKI